MSCFVQKKLVSTPIVKIIEWIYLLKDKSSCVLALWYQPAVEKNDFFCINRKILPRASDGLRFASFGSTLVKIGIIQVLLANRVLKCQNCLSKLVSLTSLLNSALIEFNLSFMCSPYFNALLTVHNTTKGEHTQIQISHNAVYLTNDHFSPYVVTQTVNSVPQPICCIRIDTINSS